MHEIADARAAHAAPVNDEHAEVAEEPVEEFNEEDVVDEQTAGARRKGKGRKSGRKSGRKGRKASPKRKSGRKGRKASPKRKSGRKSRGKGRR